MRKRLAAFLVTPALAVGTFAAATPAHADTATRYNCGQGAVVDIGGGLSAVTGYGCGAAGSVNADPGYTVVIHTSNIGTWECQSFTEEPLGELVIGANCHEF
jgi:hypothetical protein